MIQLQAVTKAGVPRTRTECDRGGQRWYARDVLEPKDYSWMHEIAVETLEVFCDYLIITQSKSEHSAV